LDPSFTQRTTRFASVWADTYAFCKAKPTIMPVKKAARKSFVKIFDILKGLSAFFAQLDGQETSFLTS
jgi:hypothetical protein